MNDDLINRQAAILTIQSFWRMKKMFEVDCMI